MDDNLPDTPDGNAIRDLVRHGSDLSKPMLVNFHVAVPDEDSARAFGAAVAEAGFSAEVYESPECRLPWTCECSTLMLVDLHSIAFVQEELGRLAETVGGLTDGWGSFGNADANG